MNSWYEKGLQAFTAGDIDWINDSIKLSLLFTGIYVPDFVNHNFYSEVDSSSIASILELQGRNALQGVMYTEDDNFLSVPSPDGLQVDGIIVWKDTTFANSSILIAFLDKFANLPRLPNGNDIPIEFPNGIILSLKEIS